MRRKIQLANNNFYHVYNRSIAHYKIFNNSDYQRMLQLIKYFQIESPPTKFSYYINSALIQKIGFEAGFNSIAKDQNKNSMIIAYCLMPTHIHLILQQLQNNGISNFMSKILNSYTRYFNTKHKRKGPLWESKFQNILIENDEQLLHLTRYIHLNPVTAKLVDKPEEWDYSSYNEYISNGNILCQYDEILDIDPKRYRTFVNERISDQKLLAKIKKLTIEQLNQF